MRQFFPVAVLLTASCGSPQETGPRAMVGQVVDPEGSPVEGLRIESVEAEQHTDGQGRFALRYLPREQFVHFRLGDGWYRRRYVPADQGAQVTLALPRLADTQVFCELSEPCDLNLEWSLGERFSARARSTCEPQAPASMSRVPTTKPTATCRGSDRQLTVESHEGGWKVQ